MNIKIGKGKVMVKQDEAIGQIGSLFIPESSQKKARQGTVILAGENISLCEKGDKVQYVEFCGNSVVVGDEEFIIFNEVDILVAIGNG